MSHACGRSAQRLVGLAILVTTAAMGTGCGSVQDLPRPRPRAQTSAPPAAPPAALLREARPIGVGPRFAPPVTGPVIGPCQRALGPRTAVHIELFAASRVVIVPAGIGTRPPRSLSAGGTLRARCYGDVVTVQPTGVVLIRAGAHPTLASVFRSWGQPLSVTRLSGFRASRGAGVAVYVNGRRRGGRPGDVRLAAHGEIVLEVGPHVPPHASFAFPQLP